MIIFNEGQLGRQELFIGTLGNPKDIPVVGLSYADARELNRSATILEIAETMAEQKIKPRRALRFSFWGARPATR